jgi:flavin-dependent dehydrogenase
MGGRRKTVAVVGAGMAGLTCALDLAESHDVEIFEACQQNRESRPLQMEGSLNYLDNVPDLEPTYPVNKLELTSENETATFEGHIGHLFMIGGTDGIDARLRRKVSSRVDILHSSTITDLDMLSDYDVIVAADGYRSRIALMAGMREERTEVTGLGIGLTVKGDFEVGNTFSLFDNNYAPGGYLYLIPISEHRASLVSASIGIGLNAAVIRQRLRDFAGYRGCTILKEWADIEKWYHFNSYQKDNIYVIGGAASFTDGTYGFGLKYSLQSARICAQAINSGENYQELLAPVLKELAFWKRIGSTLVSTSNSEKDIFVRLAKNRIVKNRIERGKSIRPFFRTLVNYYKFRQFVSIGPRIIMNPTPVKT